MAFLRFSTDDYAVQDKVDALRDTYAAIANVDISLHSEAPVDVLAGIQLLPGVSIGYINCSPLRAHRGKAQLADGNDDLVFLINAAATGSWVSGLKGHEDVHCRPGEGSFMQRDKAGYIESYEQTRNLMSIAFSREYLMPMVADPDTVIGSKLTPSEAFRHLADYAGMVIDQGDALPAENAAETAAQLYDLAILTLGGEPDTQALARRRGLRAARLRAIKADIAVNAMRGDLSLDRIASRHGITPAYVRALFDYEETTFTDYLLEQRLGRVHRLLSDKRYAGYNISSLVFGAGFNNLSWFYRAFKRQYGMTPSELRACQE